jgi:hypothetical protein
MTKYADEVLSEYINWFSCQNVRIDIEAGRALHVYAFMSCVNTAKNA